MRTSLEHLGHLRVLVVDDEPANVLLLQRLLERVGHRRVETTTDPRDAIRRFAERQPALVLLDLHMPGMDGFQLMRELSALAGDRDPVAFLVLTADATEETKQRALSEGARDFLTKPFSQSELLLRVHNLLEAHLLHHRLSEQNATLGELVAERTRDLEHARLEVLNRLALAAEYRDDDTQEHARRIGRSAARLGRMLGLAPDDVGLLARAAPLHDIGKIGIADAILLKRGGLTDRQRAEMQHHTTIGAEILSGSESPLLQLAERIALTHHERWDGSGYPRRLLGPEIPQEGRIVAVADVFDALAHERPYKRAWPVQLAVEEIVVQRGRQFDPAVVDAFVQLDHRALLDPVGEDPWEPGLASSASRDRASRIPSLAADA
jgi:putative two-component system response regulator